MADNLVKPVDNSVKPAEFQVSKFFLFLSWLYFISIEFFLLLPNFTKFFKIRRIHHLPNFKEPLNFETLVEPRKNPINSYQKCLALFREDFKKQMQKTFRVELSNVTPQNPKF
jgi:hypothetical protein